MRLLTAATFCFAATLLVPVARCAIGAESHWTLVERSPIASRSAELVVRISDAAASNAQPGLPVRAVVTASDGSHADGSGNGVYADGRFYADGHFSVVLPAGDTHVALSSGPHYMPIKCHITLAAGERVEITAELAAWFEPSERGWYAGDNHVHAQHDARATVATSLDYTALQGRAGGLNFITEAGSNVSYERISRLDTDRFLLRTAQEIRPGPFVGHFNTPGISHAIPTERLEQIYRRPLPGQALAKEVHRLGGVVIHTHPLTPPHQLHWMGAAELLSDAVLGRCSDLVDVDSRACEQLWFAALNLGNRVAVSSYTDSALGRKQTRSPGDRRIYVKAERFDYASIVDAMRRGRTMATSGGPVFAFLEVEGKLPGDTIELDEPRELTARIELQSLHPLRSAELIRGGRVVQRLDVQGKRGQSIIEHAIEPVRQAREWFVLRAEDENGDWAITSPIYVTMGQDASPRDASLVLLEVCNAERFIKLRREFFAHVIVTVAPHQSIQRVELLRDEEVLRSFEPSDGDSLADGKIPVTEINGPYEAGWIWHTLADRPVHFQADWPVGETGWYRVRVTTGGDRVLHSDAMRFDADHPASRALSVANLQGPDTELTLHGYGEEMPLAEITTPFEGDHWWYPRNTYWSLTSTLHGERNEHGGGYPDAAELFRGR
ncbi:MAG: CehA/McbA family metallohydrolase [Pirellulales bacterium]